MARNMHAFKSYFYFEQGWQYGIRHGMLVRYAFFAMVRVRNVGTVRFENRTEVQYAGTVRFKVRGM